MIRHIFKYSLLFGIIFSLVTCDKVIYDKQDDGLGNSQVVYLRVNKGMAANFRSSPTLPDDPTMNEDTADYEDRVNSVSLLVFDSNSGNQVGSYFSEDDPNNNSGSFLIKLTPGERDFYFVANMPASGMKSIDTRVQMETYLSTLRDLDVNLYEKATKENGFPMSRVYLEQTVTEGGNVYQPLPFKPNGDDKVKLIRAVAKLEVMIPKDEVDALERITLKNPYRQYHLQHGNVVADVAQGITTLHSTIIHHSDVELKVQTSGETTDYYTYVAYMPEALMTNASWTATDHKPINYFVVEAQGQSHKIPIVTTTDYEFEHDYLAFATNPLVNGVIDPTVYNLYRNRRYLFRLRNLSNIEVEYNIVDWTDVPYTLFMGYGYNVIIDKDGEITIENTIDDCMPHYVELEALNNAYFGDDTNNKTIKYGYKEEDTPVDEEMKAGYKKTFEDEKLNTTSVAEGEEYLKIYYNGILVKTYKK